jgi:hypothetical protein
MGNLRVSWNLFVFGLLALGVPGVSQATLSEAVARPPLSLRTQIAQAGGRFSVVQYDPASDQHSLRELTPSELERELKLAPAFPDRLENSWFRVVEGMKEDVLPVNDFDGRNVLFHLMKARAYFSQFDSENLALQNKVTVRVRLDRDYNRVTRFAKSASHNNSRYIYTDYRARWGAELWFHSPEEWREDRTGVVMRDLVDLVQLNIPVDAQGRTSGFGLNLKVIPGRRYFQPLRDIGMDLAKVPSVIYHEAFHWVSDAPYPFDFKTEGHPLKEDFANYFGSVLNGAPKIAEMVDYVDATRVRDFRLGGPIRASMVGRKAYNDTNLLPFVFWQVRRSAGEYALAADQLIWASLKRVTGKTRPSDLPSILRQECPASMEASDVPSEQVGKLCVAVDFALGLYERQIHELDRMFAGSIGK